MKNTLHVSEGLGIKNSQRTTEWLHLPRRLARAVFIGITLVVVFFPITARSEKVRLGYSGVSLAFLPHLLAKDTGLFSKQGVDLELIQMVAPVGMNALVAGEIDGFAAIDPGIILAARGLPVVAVMATTVAPPFFLMGRLGVKSISDLAGKKVGVSRIGSQSHTVTRMMLAKKGLMPESVTFIQTGSTSNSLSALSSGAVDASALSLPFNVIMAERGYLELASTREVGCYPGTGLLVSAALLKNERPKVKKIVLALLDSLQQIRSAKSEVVRYIQKKWVLQPTVADGVYRSFLGLVPQGGRISSSCIKDYLENDFQGKGIPLRVDLQSVADFSLLDEIQKGK